MRSELGNPHHRQRLASFAIVVGLTLLPPVCGFAAPAEQADETATSAALRVVNRPYQPEEDRSELVNSIDYLRQLPGDQLSTVLNAMEDSSPVATNILKGVATDIARRDPPTIDRLSQYLEDRDHPAAARSLVLRMIERRNAKLAESFIERSMDDPALWIRRLAVAHQMETADEAIEADQKDAAVELLRTGLVQARHPKQVTQIASKLQELGDKLTTAEAMAMIMNWRLIGPFENTGGVGFDTVYPPEQEYLQQGKLGMDDRYPGKTGRSSDLSEDGSVGWRAAVADDNGTVNLASHFNKEKGATAYGYVEINADQISSAQIRIKSVTANKVWVNGNELMSNAIYHSGTTVDQYVADFELQPGINTILIKTCQNEQTESWAQVWELQCRVTDTTGKGLQLQ